MNGREHYEEAEQALKVVRDSGGQLTDAEMANLIAVAQVHATLALADAADDTATYAQRMVER